MKVLGKMSTSTFSSILVCSKACLSSILVCLNLGLALRLIVLSLNVLVESAEGKEMIKVEELISLLNPGRSHSSVTEKP